MPEAGEQDVAHGAGNDCRVRVGPLRAQLLDDQRVAAGPVVDARNHHRVYVAEQRLDEPRDLGGCERRAPRGA